jgi:hypothetical protein
VRNVGCPLKKTAACSSQGLLLQLSHTSAIFVQCKQLIAYGWHLACNIQGSQLVSPAFALRSGQPFHKIRAPNLPFVEVAFQPLRPLVKQTEMARLQQDL